MLYTVGNQFEEQNQLIENQVIFLMKFYHSFIADTGVMTIALWTVVPASLKKTLHTSE